MGRLRELWGGGIKGKVVIIGGGIVGLFALCCVFGLLFGRTPTEQAAVDATRVAGQPTALPESTAGPTETAAPTVTPAPTSTPAPSATPTPIPPTPTPIPPVELAGTGQTVTDPFTPPGAINRIILTHQGGSNFIVTLYTASGGDELIANTIGDYQGIRPMLASDGTDYYFEVDADGPWTIRVEAISGEPDAAAGLEGSGDYVSGVFAPEKAGAVPYNVSHQGDSNFIVQLYCAGGQDMVQNEIGAVSGSVVVQFADGPCFWDVQADGDWTLRPK